MDRPCRLRLRLGKHVFFFFLFGRKTLDFIHTCRSSLCVLLISCYFYFKNQYSVLKNKYSFLKVNKYFIRIHNLFTLKSINIYNKNYKEIFPLTIFVEIFYLFINKNGQRIFFFLKKWATGLVNVFFF